MYLQNYAKLWISCLLMIIMFFPCNYVTGVSNNSQYNSPSSRFAHAMAYDSVNHQILLFGGTILPFSDLSDTWIFYCETNKWEKQNLSIHPSARSGHRMVYDSYNQKVILFGGWYGDTWVFDTNTKEWVQMFPEISPSARRSFSLYYDSVNHEVVLFGGYLNNDNKENDLWKYNYSNNTWTQYEQTNSPYKRYGHTMVYDTVNNNAILFGGRASSLTNETWKYMNNEWEELNPSNKPKTRYWHDMVYQSFKSQIVLFGGVSEESPERAWDDTWIFQNDNWIELSNDFHPQARDSHDMVYDSLNQRIILFGGLGEDTSITFDDTWMLKDGLWTQINETTTSTASETSTSTAIISTESSTSNIPILSFNLMTNSFLIIMVVHTINRMNLKKFEL